MKAKMWRVRDIREELSRRFGKEVTGQVWKYWQKLGIAPPGIKDHRERYRAIYRQDEVDMIMADVAKHVKGIDNRGRWTYRIPGVWREEELREEIGRRLKVDFTRTRFAVCRELGIIPEPEVQLKRMRGHGYTSRWGWTDMQLEQAVANVGIHCSIDGVPIESLNQESEHQQEDNRGE